MIMTDVSQQQNIEDNSKGLLGGRDAVDNSINDSFNTYVKIDKKEKQDYGIIEEIFNCLFNLKSEDLNVTELTSGKGLKKNDLNFAGFDLKTIDSVTIKTFEKKKLVAQFINDQKEINSSRVDALIIQIQRLFRELKNTKNSYDKIDDYNIIQMMADKCIDESKKTNPDYQMNALAIVLYFFEMCDFGTSEDDKKE
jgi:hypothetical protein